MRRSPRAGVVALASTAMLASFLQTIMTPSIPEFPATFGVSAGAVSWVLTSALLAACATATLSGRIGDVVGKRRVLLALLGVIVLGSLVGAFATDLTGVIVARTLQGIGLGVMALNISTVRDVVSPARLGAGIAAVSASNGIGGALGLPLSAVVSEYADYHGLFWLAAGLAAASAVLVAVFVPDTRPTERERIDVPGAIGLAVGLSGVILAIAQGSEWGWLSPATLACGIGGIAALVGWGFFETRIAHPLIDLRLLGQRPVLVTNLLSVGVGFCWFAVPGGVARLLQSSDGPGPGMGLDMVTASLVIVPTGLSMLLGAPLAQRLVRRVGPRRTIRIGTTALAAAYLFAALTMHAPWQLAITAALVGIGSVLAFSGLPILIMRNVPSSVTAAANGVNAVARWLGSTLSSAVVGAVLAALATTWNGVPVPLESGYHWAFGAAAGAALLSWLLAGLLPKHQSAPS